MVTPLDLAVTEHAPERVNLLIPTIDLEAPLRRLHRQVQPGPQAGREPGTGPGSSRSIRPRRCRRTGGSRSSPTSGLDGVFEKVEVAFARDRRGRSRSAPTTASSPRPGGPPTSPHALSARTERDRFLYLIQEYEPLTFVTGSWSAMADATYDFPHGRSSRPSSCATSSRDHGLGVYADGAAAGDDRSISFQNAITPVSAAAAGELSRPQHQAPALLRAGPKPHAARNMFELGLMALPQAIEQGVFGPEWSFHGIGSVEGGDRSRLTEGVDLEILPRTEPGRLRRAARRPRRRPVADVHAASEPRRRSRWPRPGCSTVTNSLRDQDPGEAGGDLGQPDHRPADRRPAWSPALAEAAAAAGDGGASRGRIGRRLEQRLGDLARTRVMDRDRPAARSAEP